MKNQDREILIVEDNKETADAAAKILRGLLGPNSANRVHVAYHLQGARNKIRQNPKIYIVLLDGVMPEVSGGKADLEFTRVFFIESLKIRKDLVWLPFSAVYNAEMMEWIWEHGARVAYAIHQKDVRRCGAHLVKTYQLAEDIPETSISNQLQ